jgi:hypothetical protein
VLGSELGQSSRVRTVPADRLLQVLKDLRFPRMEHSPRPTSRVSLISPTPAGALGSNLALRQRDSYRRDAADLDRNVSVPLTARRRQRRGELSDGHVR